MPTSLKVSQVRASLGRTKAALRYGVVSKTVRWMPMAGYFERC
jgi:hypothetical protein